MANTTIEKAKETKSTPSQFEVGEAYYLSPITKPTVFEVDKISFYVHEEEPIVKRKKRALKKTAKAYVADNPFVMPDAFLRRAEEMGKLLEKIPVPEEFLR
jgi:hypothetical protein